LANLQNPDEMKTTVHGGYGINLNIEELAAADRAVKKGQRRVFVAKRFFSDFSNLTGLRG
jgi:hypothetical protein